MMSNGLSSQAARPAARLPPTYPTRLNGVQCDNRPWSRVIDVRSASQNASHTNILPCSTLLEKAARRTYKLNAHNDGCHCGGGACRPTWPRPPYDLSLWTHRHAWLGSRANASCTLCMRHRHQPCMRNLCEAANLHTTPRSSLEKCKVPQHCTSLIRLAMPTPSSISPRMSGKRESSPAAMSKLETQRSMTLVTCKAIPLESFWRFFNRNVYSKRSSAAT